MCMLSFACQPPLPLTERCVCANYGYCVLGHQVEHAGSRTQFGRKIDSFGAIQEKIARMAMVQFATEVNRTLSALSLFALGFY